MVVAKWMYASAVYNSLLGDYRAMDQKPDFGGLKESTDLLVKGLEDILLRLTKLDFVSDEVFVALSHPESPPEHGCELLP